MRRRFEGRQQAARGGGKGHAKGNGCDGYNISVSQIHVRPLGDLEDRLNRIFSILVA